MKIYELIQTILDFFYSFSELGYFSRLKMNFKWFNFLTN